MSRVSKPATATVDAEERFLAQVAWAYHVEGLTQSEVAAKLKVTRLRVNKSIAEAWRRGMVRISFNTRYASCADAEAALRERFGLRRAYVAPSPESPDRVQTMVGSALGQFLSERLADPEVRLFGMGWGNTLNLATRFVIPSKRPDQEVVSVMGGLSRGSDLNSFEITRRLADLFGASHSYFTAPLYAGNAESRATIMELAVFRDHLEKVRSVEAMAVAAGDLSDQSILVRDGLPPGVTEEELRRRGGVGDFLGNVIDKDGERIDHPINDQVVGLSFEDLRRIDDVILAAGGEHKVPVLAGLLSTGMVNTLVTDEDTARAVLARAAAGG